jgi:hypothetical protein
MMPLTPPRWVGSTQEFAMFAKNQITRRVSLLSAAMLLSAGVAGTAWAQSASLANATPATASATLSFGALADQLIGQGFSDIREIERKSDKLYEVKARDSQGRWMELYVDARSGEILKLERDRKGYRY